MINDKLSAEKIILAMIILVALGILGYSIALKNVLPVVVSPTVSPTLNPTPESVITPTPVATIIPTPTPNI
ncbi:hypothetical protein KKE99_01075, partial [Patescibacteria group bacterium]|nr:hypothetical protein [Patescibacteria group bacterium]